MNTINFKGSYKKVNIFIKGGGDLFIIDDLDKVILEYLKFLNSINQASNTILIKTTGAYNLLWYFKKNNLKDLKQVTKTDVYNYIQLYDNTNYALSYKDRNKLNIKLFLNWAYENNYSNLSGDMVLPKIVWHRNTNIRTYYTKNEITQMINAIDRRTDKGKEDYLIISLICYYGLRISDVIDLKISDIDFNDNIISLIQYKTDEKLLLPLIDEIRYALLDYLKNVRPSVNLDYVFITNTKPYRHHTELKSHHYIVKKYFIKAGVNINGRKAGFHSLRHSFSTMLLNEGVPLYSISTILGHQNTDTTFFYLDIDILKLKELALEVPIC